LKIVYYSKDSSSPITSTTNTTTLTTPMTTTAAMTFNSNTVFSISATSIATSSHSSSVDVISSGIWLLEKLKEFLFNSYLYFKDSGSPLTSTTKASSTTIAQNCVGKFKRMT